MNDHAIIERVLERHRSEFGSRLLGVLVGGSRATTGGDPHSDLDVVVVVDRPCRKRWNFLINGIEVETFINPPFQMRRHFEEERHGGRGVMPHLCSYGHTPIGGPRYLRRRSADIVDQERWQFRYHAADFFCGTSQMLRTATMIEQLLS